MVDYYIERPKDLGKLVVVGGPGGSGSSTIAKLLAKKWGLHRVDAGEIMRNSGYLGNLKDFLINRVDHHPEIDQNIDRFLVRMSYYPNMLVEGKMFAAMATAVGIPCTIRIWVGASVRARTIRILTREGKIKPGEKITSSDPRYIEARDTVMIRQANDIKRWRKIYHVDLTKPELYNDIVLDTSHLNVGQTVQGLLDKIRNNEKLAKKFSPADLKY